MKTIYKKMNEVNFIPRLLCLILACCLWLYVMSEQNPIMERNFVANLSARNLEQHMMVTNIPEKVSVRLRGPRTSLANVKQDEVKAFVNLGHMAVGEHTVPVTAYYSGGDVVEVSPGTVSIFIDVERSKIMRVKPAVVGTLDKDVVVDEQVANPKEVKIKGASNRIAMVANVVAAVDVNERTGDFSSEVPAVAVNKDGLEMPDIKINPEKVKVTTLMKQLEAVKEVHVNPVTEGKIREPLQLDIIRSLPDKVRISGLPSVLEKIDEVDTEPVNLEIITGSKTLRADLVLPVGVKASINQVQLNVEVENTAEEGQESGNK